MVAVDTNVLARLLLNDDAAQHQRVKALFKSRQVFTAPITVILELVWVLESYECTAENISAGLTALLDLPNFKPEQADALRQALQSYSSGLGFADALHLALSADQQGFVTFDKAFAKRAAKLGLSPDVTVI
jgi:predicted nucleic-acid-binding protein